MRPKILLAGLGETGALLAEMLSATWDVVAVDVDPEAAERVAGIDPTGERLTLVEGDASSAVVLRRVASDGLHAAVACTGSDEVNVEFLRLARQVHGIENRFGLMYSAVARQDYREQRVEVVEQDRASALVLASRIEPGKHEATGVGLGQGEIVQVEILANSSVIGRRLADLHPKRWLVGAVYRDEQLIVPHGDTVLAAGDRVLLVGEPEILPSIATLVRTGESEFPLQFGSHVVSLCNERLDDVLDEIKYLIDSTRAQAFEAIACEAQRDRLEALVDTCETKGIPYEFSCTAEDALESLLEEVRRRDVGVLVCPPRRLPLLSRIGLGRSPTARIIDLVDSPVLVSRRSFPYRKVLIPLAELPFHSSAAQLAIDVARIVSAELHLAVVQQPVIVEGKEHRKQIDQRRRELENLASLYRMTMSTTVLEGNPIREVVELSADFDLVVLPYRRGRSSFLTRPDVALNLIHRCRCSVLAMPH
jgi:Trk K+ transport system NAD-binding subunit